MRRRVPELCFAIVVTAMVAGGIAPRYRVLWAAENVLVVLALPVLVWAHRRFRLSDVAAVATCAFLLLHLAGAHFGYNEFPLFAEWRAWGWSRNHYDRVVHFAYGLLIVIPLHEVLRHALTPAEGPGIALLLRYLAVSEIMGTSMLYELVEWVYAVSSSTDAGPMFLGAQGDAWDAHKDMALAAGGALLTMSAGQWWSRTRRSPSRG
ncbi:MAG: DUF2238 domain-containing protein [Myxococcales bacterium]|nr:DUF2238 domain-containing protein [Myxococcales bacterium]MCB9627934.1 DUF2238 domain-containing protein [Sandaracinaceae bacterium]